MFNAGGSAAIVALIALIALVALGLGMRCGAE